MRGTLPGSGASCHVLFTKGPRPDLAFRTRHFTSEMHCHQRHELKVSDTSKEIGSAKVNAPVKVHPWQRLSQSGVKRQTKNKLENMIYFLVSCRPQGISSAQYFPLLDCCAVPCMSVYATLTWFMCHTFVFMVEFDIYTNKTEATKPLVWRMFEMWCS